MSRKDAHSRSAHSRPARGGSGRGAKPSSPALLHVHGRQPILELLRVRPDQVTEILCLKALGEDGSAGELERLARAASVNVRQVSLAEFEALAGTDRGHQGVLARVGAAALPQVETPLDLVESARAAGRDPLLLLLDGVQDPGNFGALIRSAYAFGADGVVVPKDRSAPLSGVAIKASAGAALHCPVVTVVNLARTISQLEDAGVWTAAADLSPEASPLYSARLEGPLALVVGAEGKGLRRLVRERCSLHLKIPMAPGSESLNASVAGALLLYEAVRQRQVAAAQR